MRAVSKAHDRGVTHNRLHLENTLDDGFWDEVYFEKPYYDGQDAPHKVPAPDVKGRMVGEFDYLAVNFDEQVFLYGEVKSNRGDMYKAERQLERAEEFFEPEWDMVGQTYLEQ